MFRARSVDPALVSLQSHLDLNLCQCQISDTKRVTFNLTNPEDVAKVEYELYSGHVRDGYP